MTTPHRSPDAGTLRGLRHPVVAVGLGLVGLQAVLRAWALYPSWFYADDYRLLHEARGDLTLDYLLAPFDSQFMPLGRLVVWVVQHDGPLSWGLAATFMLAFQLLAGLACLWALVTLFGTRWGVLGPLVLYLTTAITTPAGMWWAASLNQLPQQVALFVSIACWVRYLRSRRRRWLLLTLAGLGLGLLSYVKAVFVFGVLAYLLLAYFTTGGPRQRLRSAFARYWPAAVAAGALAAGFAAYYSRNVPSLFVEGAESDPFGLASSMLGTSLGTGMVGGPWDWWNFNPPVPVAQPPEAATHLAWVVLAFVAAYLALTRHRTGRAWVLLAAYALAAYAVLVTTRGTLVGALAGLEYRYLTDVGALFPICVGLAAMRVPGAVDSSAPRERPFLTVAVPAPAVAALVAVVAAGGLASSARYVHVWHTDNPGESYVKNAREGLADRPLVVHNIQVPDEVIPANAYPANLTSILLPVVSPNARFADATSELVVLDDRGNPRQALISDAVVSEPGPREGCGWKVTDERPRTIPLESRTFVWGWWVRIGYLSSAASPVTVRAGDDEVEARVEPGINSLYVQLTGSFDEVEITGLDPDVTLCVDTVEVGNPQPGAEL